jgi:hypothetical protein
MANKCITTASISPDTSKLTFEEVRLMSIQLPTSKSKEVVRNAQLWMPPKCVIERLSRNVSCLINYYTSLIPIYCSDVKFSSCDIIFVML